MQGEPRELSKDSLSHLPYISADSRLIGEARAQQMITTLQRRESPVINFIHAQVETVGDEIASELGTEDDTHVLISRDDLTSILARVGLRVGMQILETTTESLQEAHQLEIMMAGEAA